MSRCTVAGLSAHPSPHGTRFGAHMRLESRLARGYFGVSRCSPGRGGGCSRLRSHALLAPALFSLNFVMSGNELAGGGGAGGGRLVLWLKRRMRRPESRAQFLAVSQAPGLRPQLGSGSLRRVRRAGCRPPGLSFPFVQWEEEPFISLAGTGTVIAAST